MQSARRRKLIAAGVLAAVGVAVLAAVAIAARPSTGAGWPGDAEKAGCPHSSATAAEATTRELRRAVRCMINRERTARGLGELARHRSLKHAAQAHSAVMAATDCLAHECEGEADLEARLRTAGYFDGAENWEFAENTGCGLSAEAMVANWMATSFHRDNILERRFDEIGVGAVKDRVNGRCHKDYATFAVVVAWREAAPPAPPR